MGTMVKTGDIVQTRLEYSAGGEVGYNVLHYFISNVRTWPGGDPTPDAGPYVGPNSAVIGLKVFDHFKNEWAAAASSTANMTGVTVQCVYPSPRSRALTYTPVAPVPGTLAGDPLPQQDSATILKLSDYGERWGLGRAFFFGLAESQQFGGILTVGAQTAIRAWGGRIGMILNVTTPTHQWEMTPVLVDLKKEPSPRVTTIRVTDLSDDVVKTQRRRRPGKGI